MGTSRVVYRALVGGYEQLREEPVALETDIPFICITDDPDLTSETWTIVLADPRIPQDPARSARALKILGHPTLDDFDQTLWVDNTVELLRSPDELFDIWLEHADVAAPLHSYRASVLGEAEAVINEGLDDFARVYEQITHYLSLDPVGVEENPHWTGILARRRPDVTAAAMQTWWEHVLRYSRRTSCPSSPPWFPGRALELGAARLVRLSVATGGRGPVGATAPRRSPSLRGALRPPASRIGELEEALSEATQTLARAEAAREELITSAQAEVRLGRDLLAQRELVVSEVEERLHDAQGRILALEGEVERMGRDRAALRLQLRRIKVRERQLLQQVGRKSERLRQGRRRVRQLERRLARQPMSALHRPTPPAAPAAASLTVTPSRSIWGSVPSPLVSGT